MYVFSLNSLPIVAPRPMPSRWNTFNAFNLKEFPDKSSPCNTSKFLRWISRPKKFLRWNDTLGLRHRSGSHNRGILWAIRTVSGYLRQLTSWCVSFDVLLYLDRHLYRLQKRKKLMHTHLSIPNRHKIMTIKTPVGISDWLMKHDLGNVFLSIDTCIMCCKMWQNRLEWNPNTWLASWNGLVVI